MFRFEHIEYLYALLGVLIFIGIYFLFLVQRKRALQRFGHQELIEQLAPEQSSGKHHWKMVLWSLAMVFFIIGWANPQWGSKKEKVKRKSVDILLALDISNSMLAQDVSPDRMNRTRQFANQVIDAFEGERIGTIIFAGNAYLQMPLTTDYAAAKIFTKSANPNMAPTQGTAISDAIRVALETFEEKNQQSKALIIMTDGENHEEEAISAAKEARKKGLFVFTVGVGTPEGAPIPMFINGRNDYKRDNSGELIISALNEQMLRDIASAGGGMYSNISGGDKVIEQFKTKIDKIEKQEFEQRSFSEYESYFQYFIGIGLLLMIIEFMISYRKNTWIKQKDIF